jgi:hypothetical protein
MERKHTGSKAGRPKCGRYSFISFGSCSDGVTCVLGTIPGTENEQHDTIKHTLNAIIATYAFKNTADTPVLINRPIIALTFDFHRKVTRLCKQPAAPLVLVLSSVDMVIQWEL